MTSFINFGLDAKILQALNEIGFQHPTPIQELTIPKVLEGVDIIACAQTGTGKTAAFMLPTLHLLSQPEYRTAKKGPLVLVLVPTRELAMQVAEETKKFSKYLPRTKTVCIYGGVPYPTQRKALACKYEILVATPGRLMDHMSQGRIDLSQVKLWVLDEADRMLDMGFVDDVEQIATTLSPERQTLLFSATIDKKILPISHKLQKNAYEVKAEGSSLPKANIEQQLFYVNDIKHKMQLLDHLIANTDINQCIVFTSTKRQATELSSYLCENGHLSDELHGDMNQRQRTRTINKMRTKQVKFLVATDVAARGIDIATVSHVINFDLPFQAEDFVHRIGRTGRAGASGTAITFTTYKEEPFMLKIQKALGKTIDVNSIPGLEPYPKSAPKGKKPYKSSTFERPRRAASEKKPFKTFASNYPKHGKSEPQDSFSQTKSEFREESFKPRWKDNDTDQRPRFSKSRAPQFRDFSDDDHKPGFKPRGNRPSFHSDGDSKPGFKPRGNRPGFHSDGDSKPSFKPRGNRPSFHSDEDSKPGFKPRGNRPGFNSNGDKPSFNRSGGNKPGFRNADSRPSFKNNGNRSNFNPKKAGISPKPIKKPA